MRGLACTGPTRPHKPNVGARGTGLGEAGLLAGHTGGVARLLGPGGCPGGIRRVWLSAGAFGTSKTDSERSETLPGLETNRSALEMAFDCAKVIPPHMRKGRWISKPLASH